MVSNEIHERHELDSSFFILIIMKLNKNMHAHTLTHAVENKKSIIIEKT